MEPATALSRHTLIAAISGTTPMIDPVIQAFRQQRRLIAISPFNESLHQSPPQIARPHIPDSTFSRSQGQARQSDETSGMSALRLIAARCCTAVAGVPGHIRK
jgi:hypothetical protein